MQEIEIGPQPDRDAALADERPRLRIHESAAAGREHVHGVTEEPGNHLTLTLPEDRLAASLEDLLDGLAGSRLDLAVGVDKGEPESLRQAAADVGLAGAHQAH